MNGLKIYHHHIPKTGGTTIKETLVIPLAQQLGLRLHHFDDMAHIRFDSDAVENYDFFIWHLGTDPYKEFPNIPSFTTLRHPITRVISHFFFGLGYFSFYKEYENIKDIDILFNMWLDDEKFKLSTNNHQTRFLTMGMDDKKPFPVPPNFKYDKQSTERIMYGFDIKEAPCVYEVAKIRLNSMVVSGVIERLGKFNEEFISHFETNYDVKFKHIKEQKENVNRQSQEWIPILSKKYGNKILEKNQIDLALWEHLYNK